ncbi:MAG: InlB B-repeat-containing protein [Oscillospiraceae bacterium]|nr:InlB B-repeat-containing protein [Oscillospiraceae bacterium]
MNGSDASDTIALEQGQILSIRIANLKNITDKRLEIIIPEGLTVTNYPGMDGSELPSNLASWMSLAVDAPVTTWDELSARFGSIVYNINDGTDAIAFNVSIAGDPYRYHCPGTTPSCINSQYKLPEPLQVILSSSAVGLEIKREITMSASATQFTVGKSARSHNILLNATIWTSEYSLYGLSPTMFGASYLVPKSGVVTLTWPPEAKLVAVNSNGANGEVPPLSDGDAQNTVSGADDHVVINSANRTATFYYSKHRLNPQLQLEFISGTDGIYFIKHSYILTMYDDVVKTLNFNGDQVSLITKTGNRLTASTRTRTVATVDANQLPGLTLVAETGFSNDNANPVTDQFVRFDIPLELHVRAFYFPKSAAGSITVKYKVWEDAEERETTGGIYGSGRILFTAQSLSLAEGEYIEWAEANVGDFPVSYRPADSTYNILFFGNIDLSIPNSTLYIIKVTITSQKDGDTEDPVAVDAKASSSNTPSYYAGLKINITKNESGSYTYYPDDDIKVESTLSVSSYYNSLQRMKNPDLFILLPKDVDLKPGSLTVKQGAGNVDYTMDGPITINDGTGRQVIRIHTQAMIGYYTDDISNFGSITLNFTLTVRKNIDSIVISSKDIVFASATDGRLFTTAGLGSASASIVDTLDLNGNSNTTDRLISNYEAKIDINILATPELRLNAGIGLAGQPSITYDPANPDATTVPLTTGVPAKYALHITNTTGADAGFTSYIPVPHTGLNYGPDFQTDDFTWNMALAGPPEFNPASSNYVVTYTNSSITNSQQAEDAAYKTEQEMNPDDWAGVTMIRITNINPVPSDVNDTITFTYKADDDSVTVPAKVNIFNPYYRVVSPVAGGYNHGASVAASLTSGEISGFVWVDDNRNGIRDLTETKRAGVTVRLRLPDEGAGSNYGDTSGLTAGSDADGNYVQVTTNTDGNYTFPLVPAGVNYDVQFINPNDYNFQFTDQNAGDGQNDSDAEPATGIAYGVDPTDLAESRYINAGLRYLQYTVTFDKGDGDTEAIPNTSTVTRPNTTVVQFPDTPPTKTCHRFDGYYTNPVGGAPFTETTIVNESQTVYARYSLIQHTITFDSNGAETEATPGSKTVICPATTVDELPSPPSKPCHTFVGWFDTANQTGGTEFTDESTVDASKTVYARYQEIQYTVRFHSNDGDTPADPDSKTIMCTNGKLGALPTPPSRDCHQFVGWFDTDAATDGSQFSAASTINSDRDLYARWQRITHTITYSSSQATSGDAPAAATVSCGDDYSPAGPGTLARFGYTFAGWSTTNGGEAIANLTNVHANQTLYPVWKANDYTLSFALDGETAVIEHVHLGDVVNLDDFITQPSKPGYTLLGYSTDPNAKKALFKSPFTLTANLLQQLLASAQSNERDTVIPLYPVFQLSTHMEMLTKFTTVAINWFNAHGSEHAARYWDTIELLDMEIKQIEVPDIDPDDIP